MDKFFGISKKNSTIKAEVIGGITTFLTMAYIIVVNPGILSTEGTGMTFSGVLFATVLVSAVSCILMGLIANLPYALAPGMGLNAFFTYSIVLTTGVSWQTALGAVFISGIIFIILSVTKIRTLIVRAIPKSLRFAVAGGIGLFLTFIGLQNVGFVVDNPATLVSFGGLTVNTTLFAVGLVITAILVIKKVRGALLISIVIMSVITLITSIIGQNAELIKAPLVTMPEKIFDFPTFDMFFKLDILSALSYGMIGPIFALLFTDMFDSISTFVGLSYSSGLVEKDTGEPINVHKGLFVDAIGTTLSGLFGTSPATTYIESASGIEEGARTGLSSIITGLLFLPFMFLSPLLEFIPGIATAPILVVVGVYMMRPITQLDWKNFEESIPAFMAMVLIPLTYSITQGILWGFIIFTLVKLLMGKAKDISIMLYIIDVIAIVGLVLGYL
jgi:AGZA family xanthine/uracil permease-like MFS transporter